MCPNVRLPKLSSRCLNNNYALNSVTSIRAFIAITIEDAMRPALERAQKRLARSQAHVSWTKSENLHGTLMFLGNLSEKQVMSLGLLLNDVVKNFNAFAVEVKGLHYFGSPRKPRIVWAGLQPPEPLIALEKTIRSAMASSSDWSFILNGLKPFHPHITLGRVRSARNAADLIQALARDQAMSFGTVKVTDIFLMQSRLTPQGPLYGVLHEAALG